MDRQWLARAVSAVRDDDLAVGGQPAVPNAVERLDALLRSWAIGFASRRHDVESSALTHGRRGLHADECAAFLRALDNRQLHVDSAGFVVPLCAAPKPGQKPYALCCKSGTGVGVNLEYVIQLGVLAELATVSGWPRERLCMELGEFDAAALDEGGTPAVLVEAKARATGPDSLETLLGKWIGFGEQAIIPTRGENAANKYLELLAATQLRPEVTVLLVAAGARWWLTAARSGDTVILSTLASAHGSP